MSNQARRLKQKQRSMRKHKRSKRTDNGGGDYNYYYHPQQKDPSGLSGALLIITAVATVGFLVVMGQAVFSDDFNAALQVRKVKLSVWAVVVLLSAILGLFLRRPAVARY